MTTSYKATARVTLVLEVVITNDETSLDNTVQVRELAAQLASEGVTRALKDHWRNPDPVTVIEVVNWPEAVAVDVSLNWSRDE